MGNPLNILRLITPIPFGTLFLMNRSPTFHLLLFLRIPSAFSMDLVKEQLQRYHASLRRETENVHIYNMAMYSYGMHMLIVMGGGGIYWMQPVIGVFCLAAIPGISALFVISYLLNIQIKSPSDRSKLFSRRMYIVAFLLLVVVLLSIPHIVHSEEYLSNLIPNPLDESNPSHSVHFWISPFLEYRHRASPNHDIQDDNAFDYSDEFDAVFIAPFVEESFKFLFVSFIVLLSSMWSRFVESQPFDHRIESLMIIFCAFCGGCGFATIENLNYLTSSCCTLTEIITASFHMENHPDSNVLEMGIRRGIFCILVHGSLAGIIADLWYLWMDQKVIGCGGKIFWLYFVSTIPTMMLHGLLNYIVGMHVDGPAMLINLINLLPFTIFTLTIARRVGKIEENRRSVEEREDGHNDLDDTSTGDFDLKVQL